MKGKTSLVEAINGNINQVGLALFHKIFWWSCFANLVILNMKKLEILFTGKQNAKEMTKNCSNEAKHKIKSFFFNFASAVLYPMLAVVWLEKTCYWRPTTQMINAWKRWVKSLLSFVTFLIALWTSLVFEMPLGDVWKRIDEPFMRWLNPKKR